MLKHPLAIAAIGAFVLAAPATTLAQNAGSGTPGALPPAPAETMAPPSAAQVTGKDVVNVEGDTIGSVKAVQGEQLIVSVGGFLGLGKKDVAIPLSAVTVTGAGEETQIATSLTEEELKAMPEHKAPATGSATSR